MAIKLLGMSNLEELQDMIKGSDSKVIVDFFAEWCGPCKMLSPVLHEISDELGDEVDIIKVDIDKNPEIAANYNIQAVPTLLFVKNGEVAETEMGFMPKDAILELLNK